MIVMKFGGSSVADSSKIRQTIEIITAVKQEPIAIIFSAMKGVTNLLVEASELAEKGDITYKKNIIQIQEKHLNTINELFNFKAPLSLIENVDELIQELSSILTGVQLVKECSIKTADLIISFGERLNCQVISAYLNFIGQKAQFIDSRSCIKTDSSFGKGNVDFKTSYQLLSSKIESLNNTIPIITGFIASDEFGKTTTLGRNGSDYTASIVGAALNASKVEIWTDVDGVLTADPRIVPNAFVIPKLSIQEAMELSFFGAEVIHPYTLIPTTEKNIPVYIKNTLNPGAKGTLISKESSNSQTKITGIASIDKLSLINIEGGGMIGMPGMASQIFSALAEAKVNIIMITQASSEHSISILCRTEEVKAAQNKIKDKLSYELRSKKIQNIQIKNNLVIIAVIGENMKGQLGLSGELFSTLGDEKINILAIAQGSSELNISFVVHEEDKNKALMSVHKKFIG